MAISLEGLSATTSAYGSSIDTDDDVLISLAVGNDGDDASVTVWFQLSDGSSHSETVSVGGQSSQAVSWRAGRLPAGSHTASASVSVDTGFSNQAVGDDQVQFQVRAAGGSAPSGGSSSGAGTAGGGSSGGESQHDPNDFRLEVQNISMRTEGGEVVHASDEAFATETVVYYAEIVNNTFAFLGPFEVHFTVDGQSIAWGGMSHQGLAPSASMWVNGQTEQLSVGNHQLSVVVESADPNLFVGSSQELELRVLANPSRRAMPEGAEVNREGWSQRMVYIGIKDFAGRPLEGEAYVEFSGPGGKSAERGTVDRGDLTLDNVWVPVNDGQFNITVTSGSRTLTGIASFADDGAGIVKNFTQGKRRMTRTFETVEQFRVMIAERGMIGMDFKVFSAEVELSSEQEWTSSFSEGTEYEFWFPQDTLEDAAQGTAEER